MGKSAHGRERSVIQTEKRDGAGAAGGGGKAAIATAPPPPERSVLHTQKPAKIGGVSKTTWRFGPEDLVKTKFIIIHCYKSIQGYLNLLKNLKTASLEAELQLSKL